MKRKAFLLIAVFAMGCLPLGARQKGPRIEFASTTVDFDKVTEGETLHHVFKFKNTGDATLEIVSVTPSCGCTSTLLSENKIAPGASGEIKADIVTEGQGPELHKIISVLTNQPGSPSVQLTITAKVQPEFVLSEPSIYFGSVPRGQPASKEIVVAIPSDKPIKILSASSTDEYVKVRLEPVSGSNGKKIRVVADQTPDAPAGYHFGAIVLKTTSALKPELKIPVRGMITKDSR